MFDDIIIYEVEVLEKLVLAMICDEDKERVQKVLMENGYISTLIATTGDFLEFGKSILLLGIAQNDIERVKKLLDETAKLHHIKDGEQLKANIFVMDTNLIK